MNGRITARDGLRRLIRALPNHDLSPVPSTATPPEPAPLAPPPARDSRFAAAARQSARHWPALVVGVGVLFAGSAWIAAAWFAASRLAYVSFVGSSLRTEQRRTAGRGLEASRLRFARFSARASWLMDNDAVALGALCLVTAGTLPAAVSWTASIVAGAVLVVVGIGVKVWATSSLSAGSYHWRDSFIHPGAVAVSRVGPYRWLSNPMYTLGYAHAYGAALILRSSAGLAAALFAQATILVFHVLVEQPHLRRLRAQSPLRSTADAAAAHPSAG